MIALLNAHRTFALLLVFGLWMAFVSGACRPEPATTSVRQELAVSSANPKESEPDPKAAPAPAPASRDVATLNGDPIARRELIQILIETRGLNVLQQLLLLQAAKHESSRLGLVVSPTDIQQEYELTMHADRFNGKDPSKLTPARREQMIQDWSVTRGVSRRELDIAMQRQAYLRKIAVGRVKVTDEMLRHEHKIRHGERLEVRHIQVAAQRVWPRIKARLDAGDDFEKLVTAFSENGISRTTGGLLPPFAAEGDPTVPPVFAKAASALQPGEVSNLIEAEGAYHVLKLERRIPADDVTFEAEADELRKVLEARLVAEEIETLGQQLLLRAEIKIDDPLLRKQYEDRRAAKQLIGPPLATP